MLLSPDTASVTFTIESNDEGRFIEAIAMDADGDGRLAPDEQAAYFSRLDAQLREGLQITIAGRQIDRGSGAGWGEGDLARPPAVVN